MTHLLPCPQPSGYVQVLCTTHPPFRAPLALTGTDPFPLLFFFACVAFIGAVLVLASWLHRRANRF